VPSSEKQAAKEYLEGEVIPSFIEWLAKLEKLPDDATVKREKPSFAREWEAAR
jgi:hypothetical protein